MMTDDAERERFEAWANERELDLTPGYPGQYSDCNTDFAWDAWKARAALSARADRPEPATGVVYGGKGEAVAYTTPEAISALSRKSAGMFTVYSFPQKLASVPLYTVPQAECAPREAVCDRIVCWHNRSCVNDDAATMRNCPHRAAPQAECAPREAQPVAKIDADGDFVWLVHNPKFAEGTEFYASPTPERADAGKDAALTDEEIVKLWIERPRDIPEHRNVLAFARAILTAKEKKS